MYFLFHFHMLSLGPNIPELVTMVQIITINWKYVVKAADFQNLAYGKCSKSSNTKK